MTRFGLVLGLVLAGCGPKAPPPAAAEAASQSEAVVLTPDELVARAAALLTTKTEADARAALADLQPLLISAPDRADVPFNMGLAYHRLGDLESAKKSYLRATAVEPSLGGAWLNLAALAEANGQNRRALQHYRAGLQSAPKDGRLVVGTIGILRKMGRHDEAIAQAKGALATDSNNIDVYNNLGLVYIDLGKLDLAQFVYQKALNTIDGADNNATLHANLGRVYMAKDSPWDAKAELERALELDPELVAALVFLADVALDDHDWDRAAGLLETAAKVAPLDAAIQMNLGIAYRGQGKFVEAQNAYKEALRLRPEDSSPYINIGVLLGEHETDFEGAIAALQTYRARGGEHQQRADGLLTSFQKRKQKLAEEVARKQKREAERKKREEEARLAAEYEAMQEKWREEQEALKKAEEERQKALMGAAAAGAGAAGAGAAGAGAAGAGAAGAGAAGAEAAGAEAAGIGSAGGTETVGTPGGSPAEGVAPAGTGVWSGAGQTPSSTPAPPPVAEPTPSAPPATPAVPPPAEASPWGGAEPAPAVSEPAPPPPPSAAAVPTGAPRGTRQAGAPCATDNQCSEGLVCGGGVCTGGAMAPPQSTTTRGTRQAGAPCSNDNQCAESLSCVEGACAGSSGGQSPQWGGW